MKTCSKCGSEDLVKSYLLWDMFRNDLCIECWYEYLRNYSRRYDCPVLEKCAESGFHEHECEDGLVIMVMCGTEIATIRYRYQTPPGFDQDESEVD